MSDLLNGKILPDKKLILSQLWADAAKDITSASLFVNELATAKIISKSSGILAGTSELKFIMGPRVKIKKCLKEGSALGKGDVVAELAGSASELLRRERLALNYLMVLSGIATETKRLASMLRHSRLCALRKTHPGLSLSEKRAVQTGGGLSHRLNLSDGILVKDNHLAVLARSGKKTLAKAARIAVERLMAKTAKTGLPIEVEASNYSVAKSACEAGAKIILLDNLTAGKAKAIAKRLKTNYPNILIEASGGITPANIKNYDSEFIDYVSTSWITLRAKPIDFSLEI